MKTVNSISGGKSSAYIAANYDADYNLFCLVGTDSEKLLWMKGKDEKTRQYISDRIGKEFIGTLEDDMIVYTILELEQYIGKEITWLTGKTFDKVVSKGKHGTFLPSKEGFRFCTTEMKILPIYRFLRKQKTGIVETRIGFRFGEEERIAKKILTLDDNGVESFGKYPYSKPQFPLHYNRIDEKAVNDFWKDKPVRFAEKNNCVGCFHRNEIFLNLMARKHPEKMQWFADKEKNTPSRWKKGITYQKIIDANFTMELDFNNFSSCDSGYCH
jgi:hypothetical protein